MVVECRCNIGDVGELGPIVWGPMSARNVDGWATRPICLEPFHDAFQDAYRNVNQMFYQDAL